MNTEKITWYVARSGGIVAWCLLALSLTLGLLLAGRMLGRKVSPAWILSVHRFLGGVSVLFTAVHVVAIMLDDFVDFGFVEVLVPWASTWKASPVAWGIIAMYLSIAIEATSFAMKRLPRKLWRAVHWSSAPLFGLATLHGYQSGTDAGRAFIIAIVVAMLVLGLLTVARVMLARRRTEPKSDPRQMVAEAKARRRAHAAAAADKPVAPDLYDQEPVLVSSNGAEPPRADMHPNVTPVEMDLRHPPPPPSQPPAPQASIPVSASGNELVFGDFIQSLPSNEAPLQRTTPTPAGSSLANAPALQPLPAPAPSLPQAPTPAAAPPAPPPPPPPPPPPRPAAPPPSPAERPAPRVTTRAAPTSAPQATPKPEPTPAEFASVGAAPSQHEPAPKPPPSPAWSPAGSGPDGAIDWVTANPEGNPDIKRREGPVPGVWKRTRRDLSDYLDPVDSN